jgi:hypothetical protein
VERWDMGKRLVRKPKKKKAGQNAIITTACSVLCPLRSLIIVSIIC